MKCKLKTLEMNYSHCIMQSKGLEYAGMNFVPETNSKILAKNNCMTQTSSQPINNHNMVSQTSLESPILSAAPSTHLVQTPIAPLTSTPTPTSIVPPKPPPLPISMAPPPMVPKPPIVPKPPTLPSFNNSQTNYSVLTVTKDLLKTVILTPPSDIPRKIKKPSSMMMATDNIDKTISN